MAPAARLGEWIDWSSAVALSRSLDAPAAEAASEGPADLRDLAAQCEQERAGLAAEIERGPRQTPTAAGFAPFQQHLQAVQRAMFAATRRLRGDLRESLAAGTPAQARLAEVDAQMEAALSPREAALLASLPAVLAARFERLQQPEAGGDAAAAGDDAGGDGGAAWLPGFRREVRDLLLAELDLRFQPVEGLLAAVRSP